MLECDVVAGCDGFHGVCRPAIPASVLREFSREYPFGWLGILAAVAPSNDELVYSHPERGFALLSLRSPELAASTSRSRRTRTSPSGPTSGSGRSSSCDSALDGWTLAEGPMLEKGITGMRSFVAEPMRFGRLFLAGDAAHIVPPTGAKGLNLALHDVRLLAEALVVLVPDGSIELLDVLLGRVPAARLARGALLLVDDVDAPPARGGRRRSTCKLQLSQLRYVTSSTAAATSLAENYVGIERV